MVWKIFAIAMVSVLGACDATATGPDIRRTDVYSDVIATEVLISEPADVLGQISFAIVETRDRLARGEIRTEKPLRLANFHFRFKREDGTDRRLATIRFDADAFSALRIDSSIAQVLEFARVEGTGTPPGASWIRDACAVAEPTVRYSALCAEVSE